MLLNNITEATLYKSKAPEAHLAPLLLKQKQPFQINQKH